MEQAPTVEHRLTV